MKTSKFKPICISFDKRLYEAAQADANQKLYFLNLASDWIKETINPEKVDLKKLSNNMVAYFKDLVAATFIKENTLGLSADKLIDAKEIRIYVLEDCQRQFEAIKKVKLDFSNNNPSVSVDRKDFETWTTSETQNQRLLIGNKFIAALNEMDKVHPVAKLFTNRLTNGYVNFDMHDNGYHVNPDMLK